MDLSLLKGLLAQRTPTTTKANFVLLAEENCNWNRHPIPFLGYMSSSAIFLLQNFSPTTN